MDVRDIAFHVTSLLTDLDLEKLYIAGVLPVLSQLVQSQVWWHARVETLISRHTSFASDDPWKQTYQLLSGRLAQGKSQLFFYNMEDNVTLVRLLLEVGHKPDRHGIDISLCATNDKPKIMRALLHEGSMSPNCDFPLYGAVMNGNIECVRLLLGDKRTSLSGTRISTIREDLLSAACLVRYQSKYQNYIEIVEALLADERCDVAVQSTTAIGSASSSGDNVELVRLLLSDGRVPIKEAYLITAAEKGRERILFTLIESGRLDLVVSGPLALKVAVQEGHYDIALLLLVALDEIGKTNELYNSILDLAMKRDNREMVALLMESRWVRDSLLEGRLHRAKLYLGARYG